MGKEYVPLAADPDFEKFWAIYPRKMNKGDARKAWAQTKEIRPTTEQLLKAVIAAKAGEQWSQEGGKWIPYPASWLRGERWEDAQGIELSDVVNGKMWWETVSGINSKGQELGIREDDPKFGGYWQNYKQAVISAGRKDESNVVDLKLRSAGG